MALHDRLVTARADPAALDKKAESDLIVDMAPHLEDFLGRLFGIETEVRALQAQHETLAPLYSVKRLFVQRRAVREVKEPEAAALDGAALRRTLAPLVGALAEIPDTRAGVLAWERRYAEAVSGWLADEPANAASLRTAIEYAAWAVQTPPGREAHRRGLLFKVPHRLDMEHLVPVETTERDGVTMLRLPEHDWRAREGFALTDAGTDLAGALDQANYCIWCHNQGKDSCAHGLVEKDGSFKKSQFGVTLAGCPLDEKISELNLVKSRGYSLGALAVVAVDNPLCAATGHRICNDCMKSCIYQKQEPVDIPQVETRTLKDVLALPWGFEIYSLLTRWNPLDIRRPLPKPASGYKVLVVGLGPAGFTLAHHLINDGHFVAAIDGLKIEPLPPEFSGVTALGERVPFEPIRDIASLNEGLGARVMAGFGGVAEYGITVRWDKNFLKIIRLLLERRAQFSMYGGVRFGGTMTIDSAFALGFDHIAMCAGAGRPTVIPMTNGLAPGVRQASDFLMALQLTGAAKTESIANLTVRLPVVVIGGGLTAIDTATEALAYYPVQVEKFLSRYEILAAERGAAAVRAGWSEAESEVADEFVAHARAFRAERDAASGEGRAPQLAQLIDGWGGVTIAYRRRLDRRAELHPQPRGGGEGDGGGHPLRRRADPDRGRDRPSTSRPWRCASRQRRTAEARRAGRPAGAHDPRRRRDPAEHRAGARGPGACHARRPLFPGLRRGRRQGDAAARRQARRCARADEPDGGRPRGQLLRRSASELCRQRRQGDGRGQAAAIRWSAACWRGARRREPAPEVLKARLDDELRARVHEVIRLTPTHHRGRGQGADGGARLPARPVLPPAELRDLRRRAARARPWRWKGWR